jgi:hypothetical protein
MFVVSHGKKMEEGTMGEGGGGMDNEAQGRGGWSQNRGRGRMAMAMGNLLLSIVGSGGEGRGYVCRELPQKEDGGVGMMGKGGGGTDNETQGGGGGLQNRGRGRGGMVMGNLVLSIVGSGSEGRGYIVLSSHEKKMEEGEGWAREEEERTMRHKVEEEGHKIEGEGGVGWQWGILCSQPHQGVHVNQPRLSPPASLLPL